MRVERGVRRVADLQEESRWFLVPRLYFGHYARSAPYIFILHATGKRATPLCRFAWQCASKLSRYHLFGANNKCVDSKVSAGGYFAVSYVSPVSWGPFILNHTMFFLNDQQNL